MDASFIVNQFAPIGLTLDRIGPFRERVEHFDFQVGGEPSNFYLLLSANGRGKTHILEVMAALMGILGRNPNAAAAPIGFEPLDKGDGRAQWDILISYTNEGVHRTEVLSIFGGRADEEVWFYPWAEEQLAAVGATSWRRVGVIRRGSGEHRWIGLNDDWTREFLLWLNDMVGENLEGFAGSPITAPTLIYFPAYRDVVALPADERRAIEAPQDWNYRPVHVFRQEGRQWRESLDNLLVWLLWLDDGRYEAALELVNSTVFLETGKRLAGIRDRNELVARVECGSPSNYHRLDQLSSGEKSLLQIFLRLGAHMTSNTILIIDEVDAHLHTQWRSRIALRLKDMLRSQPGMSVFIASHAFEVIDVFNVETQEVGLRKSGYIIETAEEEERAEKIRQEAAFIYKSAED